MGKNELEMIAETPNFTMTLSKTVFNMNLSVLESSCVLFHPIPSVMPDVLDFLHLQKRISPFFFQ